MENWEIELRQIVGSLKASLLELKESGLSYTHKDTKDNLENEENKNNKEKQLNALRDHLIKCLKCKLSQNRNHVVFGVGSADAEIVFVGEAPGEQEDKQGEPFVGRAGKLLDKMILAMGLSREQVYICNVVKCRPPNNRDPDPEEIAACEPFLKKQLKIIEPKVIIGLGRYACQTLLQTKVAMSKLRGQWQKYDGIDFMPTFHPAYLLRNPKAKASVWEDLKKVLHQIKRKT